METFAEVVRTRRTHKSYSAEPVSRQELDALLELARWAPNHHRTNPWRFRVLGPETLARLKEAAGPAEAPKLDRAPTLVLASAVLSGDLVQDEEDICATACAIYVVLLAAHASGLASYWRTPQVLRTKAGRDAVGLPNGERFLGLIHLGAARTTRRRAGAREARGLPLLPSLPRGADVPWTCGRGPRRARTAGGRLPALQEDVHRGADRGRHRTPSRLQVSALQVVRPRGSRR